MASKKVTLGTIAAQIQKMDERMERGLAAVAGDIASIDERMNALATKEQVIALHTQVISIERQLREAKTEIRLGNLEEEVFDAARS